MIIEEIDKKILAYNKNKLSFLFKTNLAMLNEFKNMLLDPANYRETLAELIEGFKKSNRLINIGSDITNILTNILTDLKQKYYFVEEKLRTSQALSYSPE